MNQSLEEQIQTYKELARTIYELEARKKALGEAIMKQMSGKSMQVAHYIVRRMERLSIAVSLEDAKKYNATKMEETVDKEKIKVLYQSGQRIQGVSEVKYIQVSEKASALV